MERKKFTEVQTKRSILKNVKKAGIAMDSSRLFFGVNKAEDYDTQKTSLDGEEELLLSTGLALKNKAGYVKTDFIKACNNIRAAGGIPSFAMDTLMMPTEDEKLMKKILIELKTVAEELDMEIIGGHTEISKAFSAPAVALTVGGQKKKLQIVKEKNMGQPLDIVMCGQTGILGTYLLFLENKQELYTRYSKEYLRTAEKLGDYISLGKEIDIIRQYGGTDIHDVSTGGLFAALWELADKMGKGMIINHQDIPILQETIEICEFTGFNPYTIDGSGAVICAVEKGQDLCQALYKAGYEAAVIGHFTNNKDRLLLIGEEKSFMTPPKGDDIYYK